MSFVESLRSHASTELPGAHLPLVWDCSSRGQLLSAAFEIHEAAMKAGLMPDEATKLSLAMAKGCADGGLVSVLFFEGGWRLEVTNGHGTATNTYLRDENA